MTLPVLFGIESQQFGLTKEASRGTAETTPAKWYPTRGKNDLDYKRTHLMDEGLRGVPAQFPPISGVKTGEGKIPLYFDAQMMGEFYYSLMGTVSSAEDSTITIGASNCKIDFNIGASELNASVALASYPIGLSQATSGSLCEAIYNAIHAAEAVGTYTVTYSRSTKLFTIARSTGTFQLKFLTGTNNANSIDVTLGYTHTDKTGAITYTGAAAIQYAFTHTFTRSNNISKPAYTFFQDRGMNILKYNLGVVKKLALKGSVDGLITSEADVLFKSEATGLIGSPAYPTQRYLGFQSVTYSLAGSPNTDIKDFDLNLDSTAMGLRTLSGSADILDILAPGKFKIDGGFTIFFENTTERDKFIANTAVAMRIDALGDLIAGSSYWKIRHDIYEAHYKAFPYGEEGGLLAAKVQFEGFYSTADSKDLQVAITNQDVSY